MPFTGNTKKIEVGEGSPQFGCNSNNTMPITMRLCADARKDQCPYYVKIIINTEYLSFSQGFCGFEFRKEYK